MVPCDLGAVASCPASGGQADVQELGRPYPWKGSRSSQFQQAGDVVCPVVAAFVLAAIHSVDWEPRVRDYLTGLYHYEDLWAEYDLAV